MGMKNNCWHSFEVEHLLFNLKDGTQRKKAISILDAVRLENVSRVH